MVGGKLTECPGVNRHVRSLKSKKPKRFKRGLRKSRAVALMTAAHGYEPFRCYSVITRYCGGLSTIEPPVIQQNCHSGPTCNLPELNSRLLFCIGKSTLFPGNSHNICRCAVRGCQWRFTGESTGRIAAYLSKRGTGIVLNWRLTSCIQLENQPESRPDRFLSFSSCLPNKLSNY